MTQEQMETIKFFCWQLDIKTMGELMKIKQETKSKDTEELIQNLAKIFNS